MSIDVIDAIGNSVNYSLTQKRTIGSDVNTAIAET